MRWRYGGGTPPCCLCPSSHFSSRESSFTFDIARGWRSKFEDEKFDFKGDDGLEGAGQGAKVPGCQGARVPGCQGAKVVSSARQVVTSEFSCSCCAETILYIQINPSMKKQLTRNIGLGGGVAVVAACLFLQANQSHGQVYTEPHGYVKVSVSAGTGTTKKTTLISLPLLGEANIEGRASGRITGVSSNSITSSGAGWAVGRLSRPGEPYLIEITSGAAEGRTMLISTETPNTDDTVTVAAAEVEMGEVDGLGIVADGAVGDTYKIRPVDTLGSFFGTPESSLIRGGTEARLADTVTLVVNGSASTYFYSVTASPPRWTRVALGSPDASNVPIPPYSAIQYSRIAATPLEFFVTGKVPTGRRAVFLKNSGTTLLSPHWPQDQTLAVMGLHNTPGWRKAAAARDADTVVLINGGSAATYFHDGGRWRKVSLGVPGSDAVVVPVGSGALVTRKGQQGGYSVYTAEQPYSLD